MLQRLWNAFKLWTGTRADPRPAQQSRELGMEPRGPVATPSADAPKNKTANRPGHITTAQRLAMLQNSSHKKNYGPPVPKIREFDRMRGAQFRMKRYTRAK